jgi:predicted amidophosphoribosyltransferase
VPRVPGICEACDEPFTPRRRGFCEPCKAIIREHNARIGYYRGPEPSGWAEHIAYLADLAADELPLWTGPRRREEVRP